MLDVCHNSSAIAIFNTVWYPYFSIAPSLKQLKKHHPFYGQQKESLMMNVYPAKVVLEEQGLRDGLQSEKQFVPTTKKLEIIGLVADAGIKRIEVTSFVHPKLSR